MGAKSGALQLFCTAIEVPGTASETAVKTTREQEQELIQSLIKRDEAMP